MPVIFPSLPAAQIVPDSGSYYLTCSQSPEPWLNVMVCQDLKVGSSTEFGLEGENKPRCRLQTNQATITFFISEMRIIWMGGWGATNSNVKRYLQGERSAREDEANNV
jgi:hypothetical protein